MRSIFQVILMALVITLSLSLLHSRIIKKKILGSSRQLKSTRNGMPRLCENKKQVVNEMLYRIKQCNNFSNEGRENLINFAVDGQRLGKVTVRVAELLCKSHGGAVPVFKLDSNEWTLTLSDEIDPTVESRTQAIMSVMQNLRSKGIIAGWRDELYGVAGGFYEDSIFMIERAAASFLGVLQYGVHINGLSKDDDGRVKMWMARRSESKSKYPSMLDQIVAGGQPAGLGLMENVIKECFEEANIPSDIVREGISAVGAVSYEQFVPCDNHLIDGTIDRVVLFNYDLCLPQNFIPTTNDDEVQYFFEWDMDDILEAMARDYKDPIKPNCYICIIDYLMRTGVVDPETPGYLNVLQALRSGDCA